MVMFLGGGGSPSQQEALWHEAFGGVNSVLVWPFAMPPERVATAERWTARALRQLGVEARIVVWPSLANHVPPELADTDLLYVTGGTTSRLVEHVREHGFGPALGEHLTDGGRYLGDSAGAVLLCPAVTIAARIDDDPAAEGTAGLGVLDIGILPHADLCPPQTGQVLADELGYDVVALDESAGVRIDDTGTTPFGRVQRFAPQVS